MKKDILLSYFYNKAYLNRIPVSVIIELLTKCNLKCEHCYLPEHTNIGIELEEIKSILIECKQLGVINVLFTGGEIFIRDDILNIVEFARNLNMRVTLLSNATLLDTNKISDLSKLYITELSTSMFSTNNDIHDSITTVEGSLDKLIENLNLLKENNIKVKIKMPLMNKNYIYLEDVYNYANKNNFQFLASPIIFPKNDGDQNPKNLRVNYKDLFQIMKKLDKINDFTESRIFKSDVPCRAFNYSFSINCIGDVFPCNSLLYKIGNIKQNNLKYIWNNSNELKYIQSIKNKDLENCSNCRHIKNCERCPGMAYFDGNILGCDTYSKSISEVRECNYMLRR